MGIQCGRYSPIRQQLPSVDRVKLEVWRIIEMAITALQSVGIRIEFSDQPCEEETKQIHEGIKAFNNEIYPSP